MVTIVVKVKNGKEYIPVINYYTIDCISSIQYPIEPFKDLVLKIKIICFIDKLFCPL